MKILLNFLILISLTIEIDIWTLEFDPLFTVKGNSEKKAKKSS